MYKLEEVQIYLKNILDADRVEELYNMISNPHLRVNDDDKKWVAYTTQASENKTVVDAMKEILATKQFLWIVMKDKVIDAINKTGELFEENDIKKKHRIPFYVLVLDQLV